MVQVIDNCERLTREVGTLAGRLAQFLCSAGVADGSVAEGVAFLRAVSDAVAEGNHAPGPDQPWQRLVEGMGFPECPETSWDVSGCREILRNATGSAVRAVNAA